MRLENMKLIIAMVVGLGIFSSCQKNIQDAPVVVATLKDTVPAATDKIKDSALLYARDIYFWYNQIPSTFNAQSYSDPNKIMEAIRAYSQEPGFTAPVDRWSFAMKQQQRAKISTGIS